MLEAHGAHVKNIKVRQRSVLIIRQEIVCAPTYLTTKVCGIAGRRHCVRPEHIKAEIFMSRGVVVVMALNGTRAGQGAPQDPWPQFHAHPQHR